MRMANVQTSWCLHKGAAGTLSRHRSVALFRPQDARRWTLHCRAPVVASAAVTESSEKLYQSLESAALELKRSPPSLVLASTCPHECPTHCVETRDNLSCDLPDKLPMGCRSRKQAGIYCKP